MAFSRAAAFRSCFRAARPTAARPQLFRQIARRGYASGGHESAKAGGDTIWAVGAIAVTVPTCWYLLQNAPDTSHGHGDHGDAHGKVHGEETDESKDDEEGEEEHEEKSEASEDDKDSDSDSEDGAKEAETPDTSDDEGEKKDGNTVKKIPDAKGGSKKLMESEKGTKQGEDAKDSEDGEGVKDKPATSKPAGSQNTQSGKQEGLSNTDTKHSTDSINDQSKKGEGTPDSAKAKGTVNPSRPQPEKK